MTEWIPQTPEGWIPLLVALLLGIILGWLFTRIPAKRREKGYRGEIDSTVSRLSAANTDLASANTTIDKLQSDLSKTQRSLDEAQKNGTALETDLESVKGEKAALDTALAAKADDLDKLRVASEDAQAAATASLATTQSRLDDTAVELESTHQESADRQSQLDGATLEIAALKTEGATLQEQAAVAAVFAAEKEEQASIATQDAEHKTIALDEAYLRAAATQSQLDETAAHLNLTQVELADLQTQFADVTKTKQDLEDRLRHARGDVAGELALLTSTMIQMKEDELNQAESRIAYLSRELETLQSADPEVG